MSAVPPDEGTGWVRPVDPDELVLEQVRSVFEALDPVPHDVSQAARAVFWLRDLDAELIPLVESMGTTAVRGTDDQWVSFALDDLEIDLGSRRRRPRTGPGCRPARPRRRPWSARSSR
jgi:hypothetical protein